MLEYKPKVTFLKILSRRLSYYCFLSYETMFTIFLVLNNSKKKSVEYKIFEESFSFFMSSEKTKLSLILKLLFQYEFHQIKFSFRLPSYHFTFIFRVVVRMFHFINIFILLLLQCYILLFFSLILNTYLYKRYIADIR